MAYTKFSTEKADYVLQLGNHIKRNNSNIFEGIDAFVIETGGCKLSEVLEMNHPQMAMPIEYCKERNIPIFGPDNNSQKEINHGRGSLVGILSIPLDSTIGLFYAFSNGKVNGMLGRLYADYSFILQGPITEGRDAINARKIEEYVVPKVAQISGKKHPTIGMVFGAAHMGLKPDLKSKRRRNFTIWNWKNFNFGKYAGFNKKELGKVYEARYNGREWEVTEHQTDLFKDANDGGSNGETK